VLKGQLGFNNPSAQTHRFSLRHELFRLLDSSDAKWRQELSRYYTPDIFADPAVAKLAKRPYGATGPQPGLVIPFSTNIIQGLNLFGLPLGPGDGAYNATQFATKIAKIGVWFGGYDDTRLASMPYVYLLPAGSDVTRPRNGSGKLFYWNVVEQLMPVPYPIGDAEKADPDWIARMDGLNGRLFATKPYASFQAFPYSDALDGGQMNTDTRLIGRSVWNTEWVLVIPGATLLADPELGLERFLEDVNDIYLYFQTYSYAGTQASAASAAPAPSATPSATALPTALATRTATATGTPSAALTRTPTPLASASPTATPSALPTNTPAFTAVPSPSSTPTPTPGATLAPSATPSPTPTPVPAATPSATPSPTPTLVPAVPPSATPTPTSIPVATATPTATPTPDKTSWSR
jgi:hypothetical protein